MIIEISFTIERQEDVEAWVRAAILGGYCRVDPRKRWTERERREAIRYALIRTLQSNPPRPISGMEQFGENT